MDILFGVQKFFEFTLIQLQLRMSKLESPIVFLYFLSFYNLTSEINNWRITIENIWLLFNFTTILLKSRDVPNSMSGFKRFLRELALDLTGSEKIWMELDLGLASYTNSTPCQISMKQYHNAIEVLILLNIIIDIGSFNTVTW